MSADVWLWLLLVVSALVYWWVGRTIIGQPRSSLPLFVMRNSTLGFIITIVPIAGFIAVVIGGFILTRSGWWYLAASVIAFVALSVRPRYD